MSYTTIQRFNRVLSFVFFPLKSRCFRLSQNHSVNRDCGERFIYPNGPLNIACFLISGVMTAYVANAEELAPAKVPLKAVSVELERKSQFEFFGLATVNAVNVGEDNSVLLRLKNNTGATILFGEPSTTCGCVKAVSQCNELLDGSECNIQIQLRPDRNYKEQTWLQTVSFASKEKNGPIVTVTISAMLNGVFVVEPSRLLFVALDDSKPISNSIKKIVAINVTPPVKLDNLKISGGPLLELFKVSIATDQKSDQRGFVSLEIDADSIPVDGFHEGVTLTDTNSGQTRQIVVSANRRNSIRTVPSSMVLQKPKAGGSWVAYGMMINQSPETINNNEAVLTPVVDVVVEGVKVPITVLEGGARIQRFRLDFNQELVERLFSENRVRSCVFDVHWGAKRCSCTAELSVSEGSTLSGELK